MSLDKIIAAAVDSARTAAQEAAADFGVGEYLGCTEEKGTRLATHYFACDHPGYRGWRWAVTMARASRARSATVNEVVLLPGEESLLAPAWVPWADRVEPGDVRPGMLLPTPDNDSRLEPGYIPTELGVDDDPSEWAHTRAVANELGLGRERVMSVKARSQSAERWLHGSGGPHNAMTKNAPAHCVSCGYFVRLSGSLGTIFGVCANEFSSTDGHVVSVDHGCGAHSDVVAEERVIKLPPPVYDTITVDDHDYN